MDVTSGGKQSTCTIGLAGEGELLPELILLFFLCKVNGCILATGQPYVHVGETNAVPKNPDASLKTIGLVECFQFRLLRVMETHIRFNVVGLPGFIKQSLTW